MFDRDHSSRTQGARASGVRLARVSPLSRRLAGGRIGAWAAVAVLIIAGGTFGAWFGARSKARADADKARLAFHLSSSEIASTLTLAIQHEEDLVINASAFVSGNPGASAADFDRWAEAVHAMERYPELENFGLIVMVPASKLAAFEAHIRTHPMRAFGLHSSVSEPPFAVLPAGNRPYYCFAVAGLARNPQVYLPGGIDYCALARTLLPASESGLATYAPFSEGKTTLLGVEVPVYRGGITPTTVVARRKTFIGWLAERLVPGVVLDRALDGHPNTAVRFSYASGSSRATFKARTVPRNALTTTIDLRNGWSVQTFAAAVPSGVFSDGGARTRLLGGALVSALLGLLIFVLGTGRRRALSLVREKTRELSHQALHDALTGLPNRALVLDRATQMLARTARHPNLLAGALFIDIDGFKHVNDNLGHAAGDELLKIVGERLESIVREQDTVGRLGGDEFVVLVESSDRDAPLDVLADRLIEVLRQPVRLGEGKKMFSFTASIGVAVGHYATPDELLRDADLALYAAKDSGKDRYALFDASMSPGGEDRLELEIELNAAVWDEQFFLHYQPIFDLPSETVVGVEALIRWRHPSRGIVPPDQFIPLAEETGLIVPIGRWVLKEAARQAAAWNDAGLDLAVSVNVSARQLTREGFVEDVRAALLQSGLDPSRLMLEITETTIMRDIAASCARLSEVKRLGVRVAVDDFGTGYASLSQLQRMPVDVLKVDRSFVAALGDGRHSRELLEAIMGVGQALSLAMVAEGIEERSQMATLREMGCEMAQGFLMGRPSSPEAIEDLLGPCEPAHVA